MPIHSTAVVHPGARIAADAEIGAFVSIEGPAEIGARTVIEAHAVIVGNVSIGADNRIGHGAIIGAAAQHTAYPHDHPGRVVIGDSNTIRELCTINRSTLEADATRVGNHNYLMAGAHLGHDAQLANHIIIANNALLGGHVQVAERVFIGGGCVFHQFVRIGRLVIAQGASAFSKDIPPFTLAAERNTVAGLNIIGLRRAGLDAGARQEIKNAFKLIYKSGLNTAQALEAAGEMDWTANAAEFFEFVRGAKKRGICDLLETARAPKNELSEAAEP